MARIMVIDDDFVTLHLVERMLVSQGYDVVTWSTDKQAVEKIEQEHPDLLLLDNHLGYPNSGWGILQELRFNDATFQLPIILCSADTVFLKAKEQLIRGMGAGIIAKPFDRTDLVAIIADMLGERT